MFDPSHSIFSTKLLRISIAALTLLASIVVSASEGTVTAAPGASRFSSLQPCRLYDSREALGNDRKLTGSTITIDVAGRCGVPSAANAVSLTLAVAKTEGPGHVTAAAANLAAPNTSNLNWSASGTARANGALVTLADGRVSVHVRGTAHLIVDVYGYFSAVGESRDGRFFGIASRRILDTRPEANGTIFDPNVPKYPSWNAGTSRVIPLPAGVPADSVALSVNITTAGSRTAGHFTTYLPDTSRPLASFLNTDGAAQTRSAAAIVPVTSRGFMLYSSGGGDVVIDVTGYFTGPDAPMSSAGLFVAGTPRRAIDTRSGNPIFGDGSINVDTTALTGQVAATVTNVTMVMPAEPGFVAAYPSGEPVPLISAVNVDREVATVANLAITPTSSDGINYFSPRMTHVVVDVFGFFTGNSYATEHRVQPRNDRPRITQTRVIGYSVSGRPIYAYRLGIPGEKVVVAASAIHGDETGALAVTDYLLNQAPVANGLDLWVIPTANPDGVANRRRTNDRGVDLNRNFATQDWRLQGAGSERFSGPFAGSEPETSALQAFVLDVRPRVVVWWHQVGNHVDDQPTVANYALLQLFARRTGLPILATYCNPSPCRGTATNYTNRNVAGATSFVVELPPTVTRSSARTQGDAFVYVARSA